MSAGDPDPFAFTIFEVDVQPAMLADRQLELGDLVALGQVRVEIVFACEDRAWCDLAVGRQAGFNGKLYDLLVEDGQGAGQAETNRAGLRVGCLAEIFRAAAKNLGVGGQLDMHFQADDSFVTLAHILSPFAFKLLCL